MTDKQTRDIKLFLKLTPEQHIKIKNKARRCHMTITQLAKVFLLEVDVDFMMKIEGGKDK